MDEKTIKAAIEKAAPSLLKGERVELVPIKDGLKVLRVRREEIKNERHNVAQGD